MCCNRKKGTVTESGQEVGHAGNVADIATVWKGTDTEIKSYMEGHMVCLELVIFSTHLLEPIKDEYQGIAVFDSA